MKGGFEEEAREGFVVFRERFAEGCMLSGDAVRTEGEAENGTVVGGDVEVGYRVVQWGCGCGCGEEH